MEAIHGAKIYIHQESKHGEERKEETTIVKESHSEKRGGNKYRCFPTVVSELSVRKSQNPVRLKIEGDMFKLTADNYSYWKPMMEDHLYCKDLYEPITNPEIPEGKIEKDWEILNRKTVAMIRKYIDKSLFEHVSTYTDAYELWTKLESMIQKKTPRNKAHLVRRLVKLEYSDDQNMVEHLNTFKGIVNQLMKTDMKIDDELQALLLLSYLPESWDTLVVTLSNSAPDGKLSLDNITDSLLNEESRRKERGSSSCSKANVVENRGRSEHKSKGKREKSRGRFKSRSKGLTCFYCGKDGHKKPECRFLKRDQKNGNKLVLKEVRHVPEMRLNLISVGKLDDAGMNNQFSDGRWKLCRGSMIVARGKKEGSLYCMQGKIYKGETNVAQEESKELWHKRLGHMSEKGLEILAKDHLQSIKGQPLELCEDCLAGGETRQAETNQELQIDEMAEEADQPNMTEVDQLIEDAPQEPQLRRSTRQKQPSRSCPFNDPLSAYILGLGSMTKVALDAS
ncbi:hypothetical protein V8G54_007675 [Vigna mungo]|uniref:CCHC-type domain-containing protein n=1 Tax=Vigna mungo TaxID=3915 RepID=A0AAQ3P2R6_VIGMU